MTTWTVPTSVTHPTSAEVVPLPGNADYDTGTNRSATVAMLANVRTATVTVPAAEGGGTSCVASDITITNLTPPLTWEMRSRLRDQGTIVRTDSSGVAITGFYGQPAAIRGRLDDGTTVALFEKQLGGRTYKADVSTTGLTNITPALSSDQQSQLVNGTVGGTGVTATVFSGAGSAGTYRAKVATVSTDGRTVTFATGSIGSGILVQATLNLYAAVGFPSGSGTWNVALASYGSDISYAFQYWLTGTVGSDDYTDKSGTSIDETFIEFAQGRTYEMNYGLNIGTRSTMAATYDRSGRLWPQIKPHAWRYTRFRGPSGLARADRPVIRQADDTITEGGARTVTGNTVAGALTITNITPPVSAGDRKRLLGPCPLAVGTGWTDPPRISGKKTNNTLGLLIGGQKTNTADIVGVSLDGTTITIAATSSAVETRTGVTLTLNVPNQEPGRSNLEQFAFAGPNSAGSGSSVVERGSMTHDCIVENLQIVGSNGTTRGTATDSRYTPREFWHGIAFRGCDKITVRNVYMRNIWGDFFFFTGALQQDLGSAYDVGVMSDNVTIEDVVGIGCGRHALTWQGQTWTTVRRSVFVGVTRLFIDSENTSIPPRILCTTVEDCAVEFGTSVFRIGGEPKLACEPPITLTGCSVDSTNPYVVNVPADMIDSSYFGALVVGTGIPAKTVAVRRLSPSRIELSDACTPTGTITLTFMYGSTFGKHTFTRVDTLTKGGFQITGDNTPFGGRAYFEFDTVTGSDRMTNVEFLPRSDAHTYTTADLSNKQVTHMAGSTTGQALFEKNDLTAYSIVSGTEIAVRKEPQSGSPITTLAVRSTRADHAATISFAANSRSATTSIPTFFYYDRGDVLTTTAGVLRDDTIIYGYAGNKSVVLDKPAITSATATTTMRGKWRGWSPIVRENVWNGWTVSECRNVGANSWTGGNAGVGYDEGDGPAIMFNKFSEDYVVEKCYLPSAMGTATTYTGSSVAIASVPSTLPITSSTTFATLGAYAQVVTSTGVGYIAYTGKSAGNLTGVTYHSGTGTIANGAAVRHAPNPMVGIYTGTGTSTVGMDGRGTMTSNRFPGSHQDQVLVAPTVTVSLDLTMDDVDAVRPNATIVGTRSDAAPLKGSVQIMRNGLLAGTAIFTGASNTVTTEIWDDSAPGAVWTAQWAGSWDTLGANDVVTPPATPTATTLTVSPASPSEEGTTITLTATVTPTPDTGEVAFTVNNVEVARLGLTAGTVATTITLPAGTHTLRATYQGSALYAGSSSAPTIYTSTAVAVDPPPTVVATFPEDGATNVVRSAVVTVTFSEAVTDVVISMWSGDRSNQVDGLVEGSGTSWTFTPSGSLSGAVYTVDVDDATDTGGIHLAGRVTWEFSTTIFDEFTPTGILIVA